MYKALLLALLLPNFAFAQCYVVANLKGPSVREADGFDVEDSGFSNQKFMIEIDNEKSAITPSDMRCFMAGPNNVQCVDITEKGQVTTEIRSVFPESKIVVHVKVNNGYGPFNGANLFVGDIVGSCG